MSFDIALSGLNAINTDLDTISNNIANSGTYGFKSSRANFASMYAGTQPVGTEIGSMTQSVDHGGSVLSTGRSMDAAIQGRGFFVTKNTDGSLLYTRAGIFSADKDGYVVDSFGHRVQGYAAVPGATTNAAALGGTPGDLLVPTGQIAAQATTAVNYVGNLSADWPLPPNAGAFNPTDPKSYNSSMVSVIYDALGVKHTLTQYFTSGGPGSNAVTVNYAVDGTDLASPNTLNFNPVPPTTTVGQLDPATVPATLSFTPANGAGAMTFNVDYAGTTQYAGDAVTTTNSADGYASGVMTGVELDKDGSVMALYSNGQKQTIGTIALATFPNENGLVPVSDTAWTASNDSGNALYFAPGVGTAGTLATGALEQSNVDVASELVNLMTSQRNYQANTKVISTENQMMQSLMQAV